MVGMINDKESITVNFYNFNIIVKYCFKLPKMFQ